MQNQVEDIYKSCWITEYFDLKVKAEHDNVFFVDKKNNNHITSFRFNIYLYCPPATKSYFLPASKWKTLFNVANDVPVIIDTLSRIPHGFRALGFQSSRSMFYSEPFFVFLKAPLSSTFNSLRFNNFLKPNIKENILAMLVFNDEIDAFTPIFTPTIELPHQDVLTLPSILEFTICDETKRELVCEDNSQLFLTITIS